MPAVTLRRVDPDQNMRRFYRLDLQPDLFGAWCLVREWGRIGQAGRIRSEPYPGESEAAAQLRRLSRRKQGKGYVPVLTEAA